MLSNPQKQLLHQAARAARLTKDEYREALTACGWPAPTSTDKRITNAHFDTAMAYMEAIFERAILDGFACEKPAPFNVKGYWANKNRGPVNSRLHHHLQNLGDTIAGLEQQAADLGMGGAYQDAIRQRLQDQGLPPIKLAQAYKAALARTIKSKKRKTASPF